MASTKKILVIGGGLSGLGSIISLKEEGFEPVCYEKSPHVGGTWFYREETTIGLASIMPTTVVNHSKEFFLSNYVPDKSLPLCMRHSEYLKLIYDSDSKFDFFRHIICNREVLELKRSVDYDETGRWDVEIKNTETGEIFKETYDGVMVCNGHMTYPKMASFPDVEKYKGKIMHTHSLKEVEPFKGKRVVVVGIGCSALDAAVGVSNVASQVYLSTRSGAWIIPRVGLFGLPMDFLVFRRFLAYIQYFVGYKLNSWIFQKIFLNSRFDHNLYNLRPRYPVLSKDSTINDVLPAKIISGEVVMRKNIKCFTENGVIFENEAKVTEADVVIMATGYTWKFPFLKDDIIRTEGNRINLYKWMYPPQLKHHSLAIIGFIQPMASAFPLVELQCRWAAQVFNGKFLPPSEKEMMADVIRHYEENCKRYPPSDKISIRVDYIPFQDEISSMFGAKPDMWKLLFTDPTLFYAVMFGPSLPYQYRLQGPHKWDGARDAILTVNERIRFPLCGEECKKKKSEDSNFRENLILKLFFTFLLVVFWRREISSKYYILALILLFFVLRKTFLKKCFVYLFPLLILVRCSFVLGML